MIMIVVVEANFPGQLCLGKLSILNVRGAANDGDLVAGRISGADGRSRDDGFRSVVITDDELHYGTRDYVDIIANNDAELCAAVGRTYRIDLEQW